MSSAFLVLGWLTPLITILTCLYSSFVIQSRKDLHISCSTHRMFTSLAPALACYTHTHSLDFSADLHTSTDRHPLLSLSVRSLSFEQDKPTCQTCAPFHQALAIPLMSFAWVHVVGYSYFIYFYTDRKNKESFQINEMLIIDLILLKDSFAFIILLY